MGPVLQAGKRIEEVVATSRDEPYTIKLFAAHKPHRKALGCNPGDSWNRFEFEASVTLNPTV